MGDWSSLAATAFSVPKTTRVVISNPTPLFATLDHLGVQQVLRRFENRRAWSAPLAGSGERVLEAITGQQGLVIMLEFIGSEQRAMAIRAPLEASPQGGGIGLVVATNDKVAHDFVAWVDTNPNPLVAIACGQFFKCPEMRCLFLTNDQSSSTWHSSRW